MALEPTGDKTSGKRNARGFRQAGAEMRKRVGAAAAGHGFAEPEVLLRWAEVVGEHLAAVCTPVKVSYQGARELGATLVVRAPGARAPEVEHMAPRILERVNQFYGYRAVSRLKVTQAGGGPAPAQPGFAEPAAGFAGPASAAQPDRAAEARAAELAKGIQHEELRAALTRMGAHLIARDSGRKP